MKRKIYDQVITWLLQRNQTRMVFGICNFCSKIEFIYYIGENKTMNLDNNNEETTSYIFELCYSLGKDMITQFMSF